MPTQTPELGRPAKAGLQRSAHPVSAQGYGTPAPGEGFALSIARRECAKLNFAHDHDRDDVEIGVALVAAKRASLVGRAPTLSDVQVALNLFGLRTGALIEHEHIHAFAGLAHSYPAQRRLVDEVRSEQLVPRSPDASPTTR